MEKELVDLLLRTVVLVWNTRSEMKRDGIKKFYVDSYQHLVDHVTVEQYYLQAKQLLCNGRLECENKVFIKLIGCIMQEMHGNHISDKEAMENIKTLLDIPKKLLNGLSSDIYEREILDYYRSLRGFSHRDIIVRFLEQVQSLEMYGVHYFSVKDKKECPKWLGIGKEAVMQFNHQDKRSHTRKWAWKQLKNIMYKEKKFIMEVIDSRPLLKQTFSSPGVADLFVAPKKITSSGGGDSFVTTYTWYANSKIVLALWKMAKIQHKFCKNRSLSSDGLDATELIKQLNKKLVAPSNLKQSLNESQNSINSSGSSNHASAEAVVVARTAQSHMYTALTANRNALVLELEEKVRRFKELQVKEMQITRIPPEGLSEDVISSMVETRPNQFKFSPLVLDSNGDMMGGKLLQLEKQIEVQSAIVKASKKLVSETDSRLKKSRKKILKNHEEKLKELEMKLSDMKGNKSTSSYSTFFISNPTNMKYTGGATSNVVPRSAPLVRKGVPALQGTVDDSVINDIIFSMNTDTPQLSRKTLTLNKSTPNLNKSSPNLSELSYSPTPPMALGSSMSSVSSSKTKSIGSLPSHSDADTQSLGRDKSHSPFSSDDYSPSTTLHYSPPSSTIYSFDRPVSPTRSTVSDHSPGKHMSTRSHQPITIPGGVAMLHSGDMFATMIEDLKKSPNRKAPAVSSSSSSSVSGSPNMMRKKIHHYEPIDDYPAIGSADKKDRSNRRSSPALQVEHHPTRQTRPPEYHGNRSEHLGSRQQQQDHHGSRQPDYHGNRQQDQWEVRSGVQIHEPHTPSMPTSRTFSNVLPRQQNYSQQQQLLSTRAADAEMGSNTLERRRKFSQPDYVHSATGRTNGFPPPQQPSRLKPSVEQATVDLFSSYNHQRSGNHSHSTLARSNPSHDRHDQWGFDGSPSSYPYGMQHPRQRSEPEHLFEHSSHSEVTDYPNGRHRHNTSYTSHDSAQPNGSAINFHDPGTFEEGTLV